MTKLDSKKSRSVIPPKFVLLEEADC